MTEDEKAEMDRLIAPLLKLRRTRAEFLSARVCEHCGKPRGVFAFALETQRGYWHPRCFTIAKIRAERHELENRKDYGGDGSHY